MEEATALWSVTGSPDGMGTLRDRVMPGFLCPPINPLVIPERAAHAMRHQPSLPHSHSHCSPPSRLSHQMGLLIEQAHNRVCVLTSILKSFKLHLSSRYLSESVQLTSSSGLVTLQESTQLTEVLSKDFLLLSSSVTFLFCANGGKKQWQKPQMEH